MDFIDLLSKAPVHAAKPFILMFIIYAPYGLYLLFGRLFGFFHPIVCRYFQIIPWRPIWRTVTSFQKWREGVFLLGRKATASWCGTLSTLCMTYKSGQLLLGRAQWMGFTLPQAIGTDLKRHSVMIAGTGAGKTTLMQTIMGLHLGSSMLVDPKLQVYQTMLPARRRIGEVFLLAPFNPEISNSWNVMDEIEAGIKRFGEETAPRFFLKSASSLIQPDGDKPFFTSTARDIIAGIVAYVYATEPKERRNLVTVRQYLMEGLFPDEFDDPVDAFLFLLHEMQRCKAFEGFIAKRATSAQNSGKETLGSILATARTQTQWLDLPEVRRVIGHSDFLLADLKSDEKPVTLYLGAHVTAIQGELSPWFRMVVEIGLYLFEIIPGDLKKPCLFGLDEFPSLGRIEAVETAAPLLRSFGVRLVPIAQDIEQLKRVYPNSWEGFLGNADVVYWMGTNHDATAQYLERILGKHTVKEKVSGGLFSKEKKRYKHNEYPMMHAEQIKRYLDPDSKNVIVTRFGKSPLKLKHAPYYEELPVWLYAPDPNFTEKAPRALFRKLIQPLTNERKEPMSKQTIERCKERFEAIFGANSPNRTGLPKALRDAVYNQMKYAFTETDARKFKRVKSHFLKTFHPDMAHSIFSPAERQAVFLTLKHIFEGEKLV